MRFANGGADSGYDNSFAHGYSFTLMRTTIPNRLGWPQSHGSIVSNDEGDLYENNVFRFSISTFDGYGTAGYGRDQ
jgi:hypothetical protein